MNINMCRNIGIVLACGIALTSVFGCQCAAPRQPAAAWKQTLAQDIPLMGHRNWIVIADSAYPAQSGQGIETIYTGASQLETVKAALSALDGARHVQPVVHLDSELQYVPETLAPGVEAYRAELNALLKGRRIDVIPHEELIGKLDAAGKTFRILILKTDLTIPYTSVFLELDCGYWGPEKEKQLREAIQKNASDSKK
jgi:hypothetical protein